MTGREAERYLLSLELFGMRFGLDRMRRLMTALGSPRAPVSLTIHVVGTNGKSSTTRMIAEILAAPRAADRRLPVAAPAVSFAERIRIDASDLEPRRSSGAVGARRAARAAALVDRSLEPDDRGDAVRGADRGGVFRAGPGSRCRWR